jgi:hypothetical protein
MSYFMSNGAPVDQAAAGLGALTGAWRDGVFGWGAPQEAHNLLTAWRDGVFGPGLGATSVLDLSDPNVMKEVKTALGVWKPKDLTEAWLADPSWDAHAESRYMEFASTQPAKLITMVSGHATPNADGIKALYMGVETVLGKDQAKAALPILSDFTATSGAEAKVLPPKLGAAEGAKKLGMSTNTLIGVGVGVAVLALGYVALKKKR